MRIFRLVVIFVIIALSWISSACNCSAEASLSTPAAPAKPDPSTKLLGQWNLSQQGVHDAIKATITFKLNAGSLEGSYHSLDGQIVPLENINLSQQSLTFEFAAEYAQGNTKEFQYHYFVRLSAGPNNDVWTGTMRLVETKDLSVDIILSR